jgi:hypothetical protein
MNENNPEGQQPSGATTAGGKGNTKLTGMDYFMSIAPQIVKWAAGAAVGILGMIIVYILFNGLSTKDSIVRDLGNPDLARGVITFIFAIGTIGIALLLTLGALLGDHTQDEFAKAKEVLTVLIGVFGTILGFYFGTATGNAQKLEVAAIRITDKQLMTHVAGGTPPYRYSITSNEKDFKQVKDQTSADGWIVQPIDVVPKTGKITVDVIDSRDLKGSPVIRGVGIADANPHASSADPWARGCVDDEIGNAQSYRAAMRRRSVVTSSSFPARWRPTVAAPMAPRDVQAEAFDIGFTLALLDP